ncbi:MAG: hypothetical protein GX166_03895 [Clostridiaceae bacterium]|nr:hypothetical protein [Clostridiaceae bacterium]
MTIGKGILNGQVPYRDLFDQKGPVIFFMHALASRISSTTFIGVYLLQFVFLIVFMIYTRKIACLFVPEKKANFIVFFTLGLIMTSRCYLRGDNVEEYVLPLIAISMYYMLDMYLNGERGRIYNLWMMFLNGIFVGFVFWLKFNLLGFWIGFFLFSLVRLIKYKRFGELIASLLMVLTGFVIVTAPVLLYFHGHNALDDLFYTYFYCNIFLYNSGSKLLIPVYFVFNTLKNIGQNIVLFPVMMLGLYRFVFTSRYLKNRTARRFILASFAFSYIGVTFSNVWYDYYLLIVTGFTVFGVIALYDLFEEKYRLKIVEKIPKLKDVKLMKRTIVIFSLAYVLLFNNCMPYLFRGKLEYPQYKFASIINKKANATMLNYGFVDGGFYFASGIQPEMKYFQTNNITYEEFPEMHDEQTRIIANRQVDFVVARVKKREKITDIQCPELFENYELVGTAEDIHDRYRYFLFEKKK